MARIVFADDELDLVDVLAELLRAEGHEVEVALDGLEALRVIRRWRPDVAVLDVDMPTMSGPAIAEQLSLGRDTKDVRVVLFSGNAHLERIARSAGVHHCMTKPVGVDELISVITSALSRREAAPTCDTAGAVVRVR